MIITLKQVKRPFVAVYKFLFKLLPDTAEELTESVIHMVFRELPYSVQVTNRLSSLTMLRIFIVCFIYSLAIVIKDYVYELIPYIVSPETVSINNVVDIIITVNIIGIYLLLIVAGFRIIRTHSIMYNMIKRVFLICHRFHYEDVELRERLKSVVQKEWDIQ